MKKSKRLNKNSFTSKLGSNIFLIILLIFIAVSSLSLFRSYSKTKNVQNQIKQKEVEVEKAKKEQEEVAKQLALVQSQEYIEKQLRDKLGLAKAEEIVVVLPPEDVLRKLAPKHVEPEEVLPDPNWKKWLKLFL